MFWTRLLSGIVLLLLMFGAIFFGGDVLYVLILATSLIGMFELYRVFHMQKTVPGVIGYLTACGYFILLREELLSYALLLLAAFLLVLMTCYVAGYPRYSIKQITACFFGFFYVPFLLGCIYQIRLMRSGVYLVWLVFIGSWGSDTCAYCAGRLFGKHKAFPVLSPKKSWEGCVGGVLGAALIGFLYAWIFRSHIRTPMNPVVLVPLVAGISSVFAQIGDLAASAIKREKQIKDYGTLIPGHGGILDRFDSVIFIAPAVYYLLQLLGELA